MIITEMKKKLDDKDKAILRLAAKGMAVKQIAYELSEKVNTVIARIREMRKYYGCDNITQLVVKTKDEVN